ncbi:MAG: 50S ribosomal protein L15 [Candidatus Bipolaricaulia bacterium]
MRLEELRPAPGAKHKEKRVGRGNASGHGNQSGRGAKGQKARSGVRMVPGFEGGQTPLWKRLPKRGFRNPNRKSYDWINLDVLERAFESGAEVTPPLLRERGLVKGKKEVKILGRGRLTKALVVRAHRFSKAAKAAIEAAGGQAIELEPSEKDKDKRGVEE